MKSMIDGNMASSAMISGMLKKDFIKDEIIVSILRRRSK